MRDFTRMLGAALGMCAALFLCRAVSGQDYAKSAKLAADLDKPLVTFIGCEQRGVSGAIVCRAWALDGYPAECIAVSSSGVWRATLPATATDAEIAAVLDGTDALEEVNRQRVRRGMRPLIRDALLTVAARSAARWRADRRCAGHCPSDFAHIPSGGQASVAGCAAWPLGLVTTEGDTWGSCAWTEPWTYAGAAYVLGADGLRYMHIFCR